MAAQTDLIFDTTAPTSALIEALTTPKGVAAFWTDRVAGGAGLGERMSLTFPDPDGTVTYHLETTQVTDDAVTWAYVDGDNPSWAGTSMTFAVAGPSPFGGQMIRFTHGPFGADYDGAPVPFITFIWAQICGRLKGYLEQGTAAPFFEVPPGA